MPELFDLDHLDDAFEALTHDVTSHTHAPGADRASRAGRRRRTTKLVGCVAALAVVAGGGVGILQHRTGERVVDPAGLPAPRVLSAEVLDRVTAGWVSGWVEPTSIKDLPSDLSAAGDDCMSSLLGDEDDRNVASWGASTFLSGHSVAFSRGMAMKTDAAAQQVMANPSSSSACTDVRATSPAPDTELLTARASDSNGHAVFAVARWHERLAFVGVSDPAQADPVEVQAALGEALLAAIQEDSTVSVMSGIAGDAFTVTGGSSSASVSGSASGSGDQPAYSMTAPTGDQLRQAFGTWAPGYDPNGDGSGSEPLSRCLQGDNARSSFGQSVGSSAFVDLSTYASAADAGLGMSFAAKSLTGCGFRVVGSWTDGPLMATRGGADAMTLWFVKDDSHVGSVLVDGWSDPPQAVTDAVDGLLVTAVGTARVDGSGSGPVAVASANPAG